MGSTQMDCSPRTCQLDREPEPQQTKVAHCLLCTTHHTLGLRRKLHECHLLCRGERDALHYRYWVPRLVILWILLVLLEAAGATQYLISLVSPLCVVWGSIGTWSTPKSPIGTMIVSENGSFGSSLKLSTVSSKPASPCKSEVMIDFLLRATCASNSVAHRNPQYRLKAVLWVEGSSSCCAMHLTNKSDKTK